MCTYEKSILTVFDEKKIQFGAKSWTEYWIQEKLFFVGIKWNSLEMNKKTDDEAQFYVGEKLKWCIKGTKLSLILLVL